MAIKIFGILIALFTITFTILSLQDPYFLDFKSYSLDFKNIEAQNLKIYELNSTITKSYYQANSWVRYVNKDEFNNFVNFNLDFNLSANKLEFLDENLDKVLFKGNVVYMNNNDIKILADEVEYQPKNKILSTNTGFKSFINGNVINGNTLDYDINNKILKVQKVNMWFEER